MIVSGVLLYVLLVIALLVPSYGLFGGRSSTVKSTKSSSTVVEMEDPFKAENKRLLTTIGNTDTSSLSH